MTTFRSCPTELGTTVGISWFWCTVFASMMIWHVSPAFAETPPSSESPTESRSVKIDQRLQQHFSAQQIKPAELTDDLAFLRRVSLDLIGRIPTLAEIDAFRRNPNRAQLIDRLIASPEFSKFLSEAWTLWLLGYSDVFGTDP